MSERPVSVSVAVLAHGRQVADVVPYGEIERLSEAIEVLSDNDLFRDLHASLADLRVSQLVSADDVAADLCAAVAGPDACSVVFTAAARRGMNPSRSSSTWWAGNPCRLGKQLDAPLEELLSTRRDEYRAQYVVDDGERLVTTVVVAHRPRRPRQVPP